MTGPTVILHHPRCRSSYQDEVDTANGNATAYMLGRMAVLCPARQQTFTLIQACAFSASCSKKAQRAFQHTGQQVRAADQETGHSEASAAADRLQVTMTTSILGITRREHSALGTPLCCSVCSLPPGQQKNDPCAGMQLELSGHPTSAAR